MECRATIMTMSSVGVEEELSVLPWMLMGIRRRRDVGIEPVLFNLRCTSVCVFLCRVCCAVSQVGARDDSMVVLTCFGTETQVRR